MFHLCFTTLDFRAIKKGFNFLKPLVLVVAIPRVELGTSGVWIRRSNQLSYLAKFSTPKMKLEECFKSDCKYIIILKAAKWTAKINWNIFIFKLDLEYIYCPNRINQSMKWVIWSNIKWSFKFRPLHHFYTIIYLPLQV